MRAGRLRHLGSLQYKSETGTDSYGAKTFAWREAFPIWFEITPIGMATGRGAIKEVLDGAEIGLGAVLITLYAQPDVSVNNRIVYTDAFDTQRPVKTYELKAAMRDNKDDELVFVAIKIHDETT